MRNIIPCLFTSGNLGFGVISMICTLHGAYTWAAVSILLAMVCDAGDFGKELDSLSDCVSFGAASGFLLYTYALQPLGWIGAGPAVLYACFGGLRLARFNLNTTVVHGYFQGMPIPNGGVLIATYVLSGVQLNPYFLAVMLLILAYLLVSKVHHPDFKGASHDVLYKSALAIALVIGAVILAVVDWHLIITMPFFLYIVFGLINTAMNFAH